MKMKNEEEKVDVILEEMIYLSHNEAFQEEVNRIRSKNGIIAPKLKKKFSRGVAMISKDNMEQLRWDISALGQRCRLFKSRYRGEFLGMLGAYVLTNRITPVYSNIHSALPAIETVVESNRPILKIYLDFDSEKEHIFGAIRREWNKIKAIQEKTAGEKLKTSKYLLPKIKLWRLHSKYNKRPDEILAMITEGKIENVPEDSWSAAGLQKIIDRTDSRIRQSFF